MNIVDKLGYSPLKWAVQHGNVQLYQALMGWEPLVTKRDEVVLLEMARERKHYKLVMIMERALYEDREVILGHHAKHHAFLFAALRRDYRQVRPFPLLGLVWFGLLSPRFGSISTPSPLSPLAYQRWYQRWYIERAFTAATYTH